jgi:hypothetical protein
LLALPAGMLAATGRQNVIEAIEPLTAKDFLPDVPRSRSASKGSLARLHDHAGFMGA